MKTFQKYIELQKNIEWLENEKFDNIELLLEYGMPFQQALNFLAKKFAIPATMALAALSSTGCNKDEACPVDKVKQAQTTIQQQAPQPQQQTVEKVSIDGNNVTAIGQARISTVLGNVKGIEMAKNRAAMDAKNNIAAKLGGKVDLHGSQIKYDVNAGLVTATLTASLKPDVQQDTSVNQIQNKKATASNAGDFLP